MKWFGPKEFARICDDAERVDIPIGQECMYCEEPIAGGDAGFMIPYDFEGKHAPHHQECFMRSVIGSVGHQQHECSCHGREDTSEFGLSIREAAINAAKYNRSHAWIS